MTYNGPQRDEVDARNPLSIAWYLLAQRDFWMARPGDDGGNWDAGYSAGKIMAYEDALRTICGLSAGGQFDRKRIVELLRAEGIEPV